jgi:DNA invertase Pin-like site-specific DNA recombinase
MAQTKRAALYLRVSTDGQTTKNQRLALEAVAAQRGWTAAATYDDNGISGAKGRDKRPGLDALLKDATRGRFNVVMVWAMDRLGRSLAGLIDTLRSLEAANVDLYLDQQAIDTTTPAGRMFFHVTGAFAEFERDMIRSRVNAGLARARARGVKLGRPTVSAKVEDAVKKRLTAGDGILKPEARQEGFYGDPRPQPRAQRPVRASCSARWRACAMPCMIAWASSSAWRCRHSSLRAGDCSDTACTPPQAASQARVSRATVRRIF